MRFLDAHIFVRYVTSDDPGASARAAEIIGRLSEGKEEAFEVFGQYPRLDFADDLAAASMRRKGITEIYSFDHDFDRVQGITRVQS